MVMGCIGHEEPDAFELDFPIQSPYALHSCGPWHSSNILSVDGSHAHFLAAAPPFAFIKPWLFSTNKRFWFANPHFFFLSITYDRYVPTPGPMSNIGLMIYAIFVRMDSRKPYAIWQGVKDTWFLLMLNWTLSHLVPHAG